MKFYFKILKNYIDGKIDIIKLKKEIEEKSFEVENFNKDFIEVDILPNRFPDAANFWGFSKEVSNLLNLKLKKLEIDFKEKIKEKINVNVKVNSFYTLRLVRNVKNSNSRDWLTDVLRLYDQKSINFLVDLSNFIMLELGTPVHIFDFDKIKPPIQIRFAKKGEKFIGLDQKEYILSSEDLVIADSLGPIALAGILGGDRARVDLNTKNIAIEIASFPQDLIYRTQRKLKLFTEAGFRFERTVPQSRVILAANRICNFLKNFDIGPLFVNKKVEEPKEIVFNFKDIEYLGIKIKKDDFKKIMKKLKFEINEFKKDVFLIKKDPDRQDIEISEDILDEIVRIYGYKKIKSKPIDPNFKVKNDPIYDVENLIRETALFLGFDEVITYSFIGDKDLDLLKNKKIFNGECVEILNPTRPEFKFFRPTLFIGLLRSSDLNLGYFNKVNIFEIGRVAYIENGKIIQKIKFGAMQSSRTKEDLVLFKGKIDSFFEKIGLDFEIKDNLIYLNNKNAGFIFVDDNLISNGSVFYFEIDLNDILENFEKEKEIKFVEIPKFPATFRDISFYILSNINYETIEKLIYDVGGKIVENVEFLDYFIKDGKISYTLRIVFRSKERTLKEEEVDKVFEEIKKEISKLQVELRS